MSCPAASRKPDHQQAGAIVAIINHQFVDRLNDRLEKQPQRAAIEFRLQFREQVIVSSSSARRNAKSRAIREYAVSVTIPSDQRHLHNGHDEKA